MHSLIQKNRNKALILMVAIVLILTLFFHSAVVRKIRALTAPKPVPPPPPTTIHRYGRDILKYSQDYTIVLVGDSMTEALGNADELRAYLREYYPGKTFEVLNNGFGSTNVLSLPDRLTKSTMYGREYGPIIAADFDLIIIESFGYNPLSSLPLDKGLNKQLAVLDTTVRLLKITNPDATIAFAATIAPNKERYGEGKVDLSKDERAKWAKERTAYIKNHVSYAKSHGIPVIDIYHESVDKKGNGKLAYINKTDYIHPSPKGVRFISKVMADAIYKNRLLAETK